MRKAAPWRLTSPALMQLRAGAVFTMLPPSVATRHLPPQAGGGTWCRYFCRLAVFLSYRSRMQKAGLRLLGGLKFILRRPSVYTLLGTALLLLCRISGGREGNGVAVMACFGAAQ